jgi:hypothetical protein
MSTLRVDTVQDRVGTGQPDIDGVAKAWVNFNGTGTVAIRASFNVTSITDNATGDYTVNFTTAMADANYSAVGATTNGGESSYDKGDFMFSGTTSYFATDSLRFHIEGRFGRYDLPIVTVAIFR